MEFCRPGVEGLMVLGFQRQEMSKDFLALVAGNVKLSIVNGYIMYVQRPQARMRYSQRSDDRRAGRGTGAQCYLRHG